MLTLYHTPQSTCSQKVRLVLAEKGVAWEERKMDWLAGEHLAEWYLKINPNGVVPTLMHDGEPILDSSVINEYLEEILPDPPLTPADPLSRARMRVWRQFIDEVPTVAIRVPSFNRSLTKLWKNMSEEEFEAFAATHPLRADFYRRMYKTGTVGFDDSEIRTSMRLLAKTLDRMEQALTKNGPWLNGAEFSLADVSIVPTIVRMEDLGHAGMWAHLPRVSGWYERFQARASFLTVYSGETRVMP
jgi:glutathione S-transferase